MAGCLLRSCAFSCFDHIEMSLSSSHHILPFIPSQLFDLCALCHSRAFFSFCFSVFLFFFLPVCDSFLSAPRGTAFCFSKLILPFPFPFPFPVPVPVLFRAPFPIQHRRMGLQPSTGIARPQLSYDQSIKHQSLMHTSMPTPPPPPSCFIIIGSSITIVITTITLISLLLSSAGTIRDYMSQLQKEFPALKGSLVNEYLFLYESAR
jgi:hypothetical protein